MIKREHLRIAQVAPLWTAIPPRTYGGIELLMKLLIDDLVARGHEVTLFASGDCDTAGHLHEVCPLNLGDLISEGRAYMYEYYANAVMASVLQAQGQFDVVHYHLSTAWLPIAATAVTPGLFTLHSAPHIDDEFVFRGWPSVPVVGISRDQMHGAGLRLGREFPIVHNGCDFQAYDPSYAPGEYLAFLGRMSEAKNPLSAIQIARTVGMPIVLAGRPQSGPEERYFAEQIQPLIDGDRVRWIGPVNHPQKVKLLRDAAALLFPIQWEEPFGLVMIEAMACGTPVVAHRRGSVGEVVEDGVTGYSAAVLDALPELVTLALQLDREEVRRRAAERFDFHKMVDDYVALYQGLIPVAG